MLSQPTCKSLRSPAEKHRRADLSYKNGPTLKARSKTRNVGRCIFSASAGDRRGLCVQAFDDVGIALFDHAALEFQGKGKLAAVEGEFAVEKGEALDGFELRQIRREPLDFAFDQVVDPR